MTDRIYTIPAREVVVGMRWILGAIDHGPISSISGVPDAILIKTGHGGGAAHWIRAATDLVVIALPGPSPRELLCSCNEWQLGQGADNAGLPASVPCGNWSTMVPPVHHADDCPVRRLRLRLWPVGATWERLEDGAAYEVTVSGNRHLVEPHEIEAWCEVAPDMRAAFCEPEVQP